MLRKYILALVVGLHAIAAHALLHDVMILNDTTEQVGNQFNEVEAITSTFLTALCQKSYAILVSRHLVENVLKLKSSSDTDTKRILVKIRFSPSTWDIYTGKSADDYYLFIPRDSSTDRDLKQAGLHPTDLNPTHFKEFEEYVKNQPESHRFTYEDIASGFCLSKLRKVESLYPQNITPQAYEKVLGEFQKNRVDPVSDDDVFESITEFFVSGREDFFGLYNFYIAGHGSYPFGKETYIAGLKIATFYDLIRQFFTKKSESIMCIIRLVLQEGRILLPIQEI